MGKLTKISARARRAHRVRKNLDKTKPRLTVFRSLRRIYAQIINDEKSCTLVAANDLKIKKGTKIERAKIVGAEIAKLAKAAKILTITFDRSGFKYCGRIQALADSAREAGLKF